MSKEKQIDEMAKFICNFPQCINYNSIGECKPTECQIADKAEQLYNAGYRKQREGEWLPSDIPQEKYVCSVCGGACWYYDYQGYVAKSRYCPNCGAKMKGGAE